MGGAFSVARIGDAHFHVFLAVLVTFLVTFNQRGALTLESVAEFCAGFFLN